MGGQAASGPHTAPHGTPSENPQGAQWPGLPPGSRQTSRHMHSCWDRHCPPVWPTLPPLPPPYLAKRDLRAISRPQVPRPLVNRTHLSTAADASPKSLLAEWPSSCTQSMTSPCSWPASVDKGKTPQAGAHRTPRLPCTPWPICAWLPHRDGRNEVPTRDSASRTWATGAVSGP